jgi:hypothetical protein
MLQNGSNRDSEREGEGESTAIGENDGSFINGFKSSPVLVAAIFMYKQVG